MNRVPYIIFLFFALSSQFQICAQPSREYYDSLVLNLETLAEDTNRVNVLFTINALGELYEQESSNAHLMEAISLSKKIDYKKGLASCYSFYGEIFFSNRQIDSAEWYYTKALKMAEEIGYLRLQGDCYVGLGLIARNTSRQAEGLELVLKAQELYEEAKSKQGILSVSLINQVLG